MGKPKLIQVDGIERESNPVSREDLRVYFGDDKWRTIYDMSIVLKDNGKIPDETAIRAVPATSRHARADLDTKLAAGRAILVREVVNAAVTSKVFEFRKTPHGREYRCVKPRRDHALVGSRLTSEEMFRPSAQTRYGVSLNQVYQAIAENRDIDIDGLVALLEPCMLDGAVVGRWTNELIQRDLKRLGEKEARARVEARQEADPPRFLHEARCFVVRERIGGLMHNGRVAEKRKITFSVTEE